VCIIFNSMVREKKLTQKSIIGALINTDMAGAGGHWILGIVDMTRRRVILMDSSIVASNTFYSKYFFYLLHVIHVAYELEGQAQMGEWRDWKLVVSLNAIQQRNIIDCGPIAVSNFFGVLNGKMLDHTPLSHHLRAWIYDVFTDGKAQEVDSAVETGHGGQMESKIKTFEPTGLSYLYRDTRAFIGELGGVQTVDATEVPCGTLI